MAKSSDDPSANRRTPPASAPIVIGESDLDGLSLFTPESIGTRLPSANPPPALPEVPARRRAPHAPLPAHRDEPHGSAAGERAASASVATPSARRAPSLAPPPIGKATQLGFRVPAPVPAALVHAPDHEDEADDDDELEDLSDEVNLDDLDDDEESAAAATAVAAEASAATSVAPPPIAASPLELEPEERLESSGVPLGTSLPGAPRTSDLDFDDAFNRPPQPVEGGAAPDLLPSLVPIGTTAPPPAPSARIHPLIWALVIVVGAGAGYLGVRALRAPETHVAAAPEVAREGSLGTVGTEPPSHEPPPHEPAAADPAPSDPTANDPDDAPPSDPELEASAEARVEPDPEAEASAEEGAPAEPAPSVSGMSTVATSPMAATMRASMSTAAMSTAAMSTAAMSAAAMSTPAMSTAAMSTTSTPAASMSAMASEDLPALPDRTAVASALNGVRPAVRACLQGQRGSVRVQVTVVSSGRVTTALVQDASWARAPYGSCIARAVRSARFPRFREPRFVVIYPFSI